MVDVVTEHTIGNVNDQMMHVDVFSLFLLSVCQRVDGIKGVSVVVGIPFVSPQPVVIIRVNYGEFSPC